MTTLELSTRRLPAAGLGPESRLPRLRLQLARVPNLCAAELAPEEREGLLPDLATPILPYGVQDRYDRDRRPRELPTIVLENERLRATIYPTLGGRLASLVELESGRELLFDNPVFQPANLALCNAWFAGGVEWNGLSYGHGPSTCRPLFAARLRAPDGGPLLRLYGFDRSVECVFRVELWLPRGEPRLLLGVRLENPNPASRELWWWTNLAVPLAEMTRVLSPTGPVLRHAYDGALVRAPFPELEPGLEGSYPARYPSAADVYFRPPPEAHARPFIAAVDGEGRGLLQTSSASLGGRKLFTWGSGCGGRRWMELLGGDYLEIQAGRTPTQVQSFSIAARSSLSWCECLAPLELEAGRAHDPDYRRACAHVRTSLEEILPDAELEASERALGELAREQAEEILWRGEAWAMLEERRRGARLAPGLDFEAPIGAAEQPWAELLAGGFSEASLACEPTSFSISQGWRAALTDLARRCGRSWLGELHLGLAALEAGEHEEARSRLGGSLAIRASSTAERALAILELAEGCEEAGLAGYQRAFAIAPDPELAEELCGFLAERCWWDALESLCDALPPELAELERVRIARAELAAERGVTEAGLALLEGDFATIREGETILHRVWLALHRWPEERRLGRSLTVEEQRAILARHPLPARLDFGAAPAEVVLGLS